MEKRQKVRIEEMTRREFRNALQAGDIKVAIVVTGSIEQHLEHLEMGHDIASCTYVAEQVARNLYPQVVVAVPVSIGISEHHMFAPGSLSAKPGSWLSVVFDTVESLVRHGIRNVLILNGHGGNVAPVSGAFDQWRRYFARRDPGASLFFRNYWDLVPEEFAKGVLDTGRMPGHAQEFETAFALHAFPHRVRLDALGDQEDKEPTHAPEGKGRRLVEKAIEEVTELVKGIIEGEVVAETS